MSCMEKWIDAYVPDLWIVSEGAMGELDLVLQVVDYEIEATARQRLGDAIGDENPTEAQLEEFYEWQFLRQYAKALALAGVIMNLGIGQQQATLSILERTKKRQFIPSSFIEPEYAARIGDEDDLSEAFKFDCEVTELGYPDYADKLDGYQPSRD